MERTVDPNQDLLDRLIEYQNEFCTQFQGKISSDWNYSHLF